MKTGRKKGSKGAKYMDKSIKELDKLPIKHLTATSFNGFKNRAEALEFSDYAKFCMHFKGYQMRRNGYDLDKWEAFYFQPNPKIIDAGLSDVKDLLIRKKYDVREITKVRCECVNY